MQISPYLFGVLLWQKFCETGNLLWSYFTIFCHVQLFVIIDRLNNKLIKKYIRTCLWLRKLIGSCDPKFHVCLLVSKKQVFLSCCVEQSVGAEQPLSPSGGPPYFLWPLTCVSCVLVAFNHISSSCTRSRFSNWKETNVRATAHQLWGISN